jgi:hypothetical protein
MAVRPCAIAVLLPLLSAACSTPPAPPPVPPGVLAQESASAPPADPGDTWNWRFAPYVWMADLDLSTKVKGNDVDVDVSFSDILDALNYSFQGVLEASNGEWSFLLDNTYMSLTQDGTLSPGPGSGVPIDADLAMLISEFAALRRLSENSPYEIGAGIRYVDLREDVHIGSLPGLHDDQSVTDGLLVGRASWPLDDRWRFALYGDAGAGDSDFTWQAAANFFYRVNGWSVALGYRVLDYDMGGSNDTDIMLKGVTIGADFRF